MAYTVAHAEVSVLPDAKNFGNELRAQIGPQADKIGKDIGERIARGMRERLRQSDVDVTGLDTSKASAKVDTFLAETRAKATVAGRSAGESLGREMADGAGRSFNARGALIGTAIAAGLMAGAPLLVGAAGVMFGGLAAVIVHNNDVIEGSASRLAREVGDAYKEVGEDAVPFLAQALNDVRSAAVNMAPAVGAIFRNLQPAIQGVTQGVIGLAQNAMPGLSAAIRNGTPIFAGLQHALEAIGTGLGNFFRITSEHAEAGGAALAAFGDVLDGLVTVLGEVTGVGMEVGAEVLPVLSDALGAVAAVLHVLQPILPEIVIGLLGMKAAGLAATGLTALATSLQNVGANAMAGVAGITGMETTAGRVGSAFAGASGAARGLAGAMGPIGWGILGISVAVPALLSVLRSQDDTQEKVQESAERMTASLERSKGAIDDVVRADAAVSARDTGLLEWAETVGVASSDVVDALLGVPGAMEKVTAAGLAYEGSENAIIDTLDASTEAGAKAIISHEENALASEKHRGALADLAGTIGGEVDNQNALKAAIEGTATAHGQNTTRLQDLANAASAANTSIGLLKAGLDALQGKTVTVNEAEAALTQVVENARKAVEGKTGALTDATGKIDLFTQAGASAYQGLNQFADGANTVIASMIEQGATAEQVAARDAQLRDSFLQTASAMGFSSEEANRLADEILGVPAERKTEIDADVAAAISKAAAAKAAVEDVPTLHTVVISVEVREKINAALSKIGALKDAALGGWGGATGGIVKAFHDGGFQPMQGGVAQVVPPNTWRVIGDRTVDDEAYIPINDSARSLAILAQTAGRMGFGLTEPGGGGSTKTDKRSYTFQITSPADPRAIARSVRDAQLDLEFLHG